MKKADAAKECDFEDKRGEAVSEEKFSFKENADRVLNFIMTDDWENVLAALTKDMDPWDVNLITLSERFTSCLQTLHRRDLRAPSRVILAAAIIYRLKSETLRMDDEEIAAVEEAIAEEEGEVRDPLLLPPIEVPLKRAPKRKVTIRELVNALGKAMNVKDRRAARKLFTIELKGMDITKKIEEIYEKIIVFLEKTRKSAVTFSSLFAENARPSAEEKLIHFNSILHLSTQERIICTQDTLFGEIFIEKMGG